VVWLSYFFLIFPPRHNVLNDIKTTKKGIYPQGRNKICHQYRLLITYSLDLPDSKAYIHHIGYQKGNIMEYLKDKEDILGHTYSLVKAEWRDKYEYWVGNLTMESFLADIHRSSFQFINQVPFVLNAVDSKTSRNYLADFKLDTYVAELFYQYAVEGNPRFLMRIGDDGEVREQTAKELGNLDFWTDLSTYLSYNELFTCLEGSAGGIAQAYSMIVVLNMFAARLTLDIAEITGSTFYLSIPEVALLAGMKEKSVRNLAHKEIGAENVESTGMTLIPTDKAAAWLKGRRKYVQSTLPQSNAAKQALVQIEKAF